MLSSSVHHFQVSPSAQCPGVIVLLVPLRAFLRGEAWLDPFWQAEIIDPRGAKGGHWCHQSTLVSLKCRWQTTWIYLSMERCHKSTEWHASWWGCEWARLNWNMLFNSTNLFQIVSVHFYNLCWKLLTNDAKGSSMNSAWTAIGLQINSP